MKLYYWVFTVICISVCSFLLYVSHFRQKKTEETLHDKNIAYNSVISRLLTHVKYSKDLKFTDSLKVIDKYGQTQRFEDISKNLPTLVLKISETNCQFCVESAINCLLNFKTDSLKSFPVIIVTTSLHNTTNTINALENSYKSKFKFYLINETNYKNEYIESLNVPYFFIMHKGKYQGELFIPDAYNPELTNNYLKMIKNEYWKF